MPGNPGIFFIPPHISAYAYFRLEYLLRCYILDFIINYLYTYITRILWFPLYTYHHI